MYKITIEKITAVPEKTYPAKEEVFTQMVETLDLKKVIKAINEME